MAECGGCCGSEDEDDGVGDDESSSQRQATHQVLAVAAAATDRTVYRAGVFHRTLPTAASPSGPGSALVLRDDSGSHFLTRDPRDP